MSERNTSQQQERHTAAPAAQERDMMQQTENEFKGTPVPADPNSQPWQQVSVVQGNENDDDPDAIFLRAVAEIDTQPLPKRRRRTVTRTIADVLEIAFLVSILCFGMAGMMWQAITYPHTLVVLFTQARPASITTTLNLPTRTLAPVTLTRSLTVPTTGKGHQDARAASGILTFYNGNFSPQSIPVGTVLTGTAGVEIATSEAVTIPAAQPPQFAIVSVSASAVSAGSRTNIAAGDINLVLASSLLVKNLSAFTGGKDARDFQAVAQTDLDRETAQVTQTLFTSFQTAFPVRPGEQAQPTTCHTVTTTNHKVGEEAHSVTLTGAKTCSALAYSQGELTREAKAAFTHTKPASTYHLVGSVQTTLQSVSPLSVAMSGKWAYTFSPDYQELLAQQIQGDTPAQARASLLKTGVISYASVPATLPPAMYITFLVLVG